MLRCTSTADPQPPDGQESVIRHFRVGGNTESLRRRVPCVSVPGASAQSVSSQRAAARQTSRELEPACTNTGEISRPAEAGRAVRGEKALHQLVRWLLGNRPQPAMESLTVRLSERPLMGGFAGPSLPAPIPKANSENSLSVVTP